jgi:hypothetical protein
MRDGVLEDGEEACQRREGGTVEPTWSSSDFSWFEVFCRKGVDPGRYCRFLFNVMEFSVVLVGLGK